MIDASIQRLAYLCSIIPPLLNKIGETDLSFKPSPEKWSKKEIIGHLIDSASNNHHRFVRGQFEEVPAIAYVQDRWVEFGYYQQIDGQQLINFWTAYNELLLAQIRHIPKKNLQRQCNTGEQLHSLEFLVCDYVVHLERHLRQIVVY